MNNNIFIRQNDEKLLKCQLAQRNEYARAKKINKMKSILTIVFAVFSIFASAVNIDILTALSSLFAMTLIVFNKYADNHVLVHKKHAASIQQYIDVTLFSSAIGGTKSEWGDLPNKTDLAETISEFSSADTSAVKNWYSDYSSLPGESQVFHCQRENIRWNYKLHKSYIHFCNCLLLIIAIVMIIAIFKKNPDIIKLICVLSWLTPLAEYAYSVSKEVRTSISLLQKIDSLCDQIENDLTNNKSIKSKLIDLQYKIRERREVGYLIPDWFYKIQREKYQKREDTIAKNIVDLSSRNGEKDEIKYKRDN